MNCMEAISPFDSAGKTGTRACETWRFAVRVRRSPTFQRVYRLDVRKRLYPVRVLRRLTCSAHSVPIPVGFKRPRSRIGGSRVYGLCRTSLRIPSAGSVAAQHHFAHLRMVRWGSQAVRRGPRPLIPIRVLSLPAASTLPPSGPSDPIVRLMTSSELLQGARTAPTRTEKAPSLIVHRSFLAVSPSAPPLFAGDLTNRVANRDHSG